MTHHLLIETSLIEMIVEDWFGEVPAMVCKELSTTTIPIPLSMIRRKLESIPFKLLKESLFVLVHHNIIILTNAFAPHITSTPLYALDAKSVYSRLSYSLLLKKYSYNERLIEFIKNGRLPYNSDDRNDNLLLRKGILERIQCSKAEYLRISAVRVEQISQETFMLGEVRKTNGYFSEKVFEILLEERGGGGGGGELTFKEIGSRADFGDLQVRTTGQTGEAALKVLLDSMCQTFSFLKRRMKTGSVGAGGSRLESSFYIDWNACMEWIKEVKLILHAQEMHGAPSARIVKNLLEKGIVEEKILSKTLLMTGKDVRERLYLMMEDSLVQLQEVPRTAAADHAPSRTLYLWAVSSPRRLPFSLRRSTLNMLHNLLLKRKDELYKNSAIITKCSRTDVIEDPSLLTVQEQEDADRLDKRIYSIDQSVMDIANDFNIWASSNKV